jgi:hypothetical protein
MKTNSAGKRTAFWALGVLVLAMGTAHFTGAFNSTTVRSLGASMEQEGDTIQIHALYFYRYLGAVYDSVTVSCMFGEFCIPSQDSTRIEYDNLVTEETETGSRAEINALSRTKAVQIAQSDTLSFFRVMGLSHGWHQDGMDTNFPDTLVWTLRMYDAATDTYLATLDSIGMRREMGPDFPAYFGTGNDNTWGVVTLSLLNISALATVDSVYFTMTMESTDNYQATFFMEDGENWNYKFSDNVSQPKAGSSQQPVKSSVMLQAFPNPFIDQLQLDLSTKGSEARSVIVRLYGVDGKLVSTLYQGEVRTNVHRLIYRPAIALPSGAYFATVTDASNGAVLKKVNLIHAK